MYSLKDEDIDFIVNDIKQRGVEIEDLQDNLLDHICCVIENEMEEGENFKSFYQKVILRFFKKELKEIEEETIYLLTFKNYYAMKKTMISTGAISVTAFIIGSIFKIMHWPGAGVLLVLGIGTLSLVFLPLMVILKSKDQSSKREKLIVGVGALIGCLLCLAVLFTIMHWPSGNGAIWLSAIALSVFVLIPIYYFTGIRNPENKVNTIVTSIVLLGAAGLLFTMINLRPSGKLLIVKMYNYVQSEELLNKMQAKVTQEPIKKPAIAQLTTEINSNCKELKRLIIVNALDTPEIPKDYLDKEIIMEEGNLGNAFFDNGQGVKLFEELKQRVKTLNSLLPEEEKIPFNYSILKIETDKIGRYNNYAILDALTQLQMHLTTID